MTIKDYADKMVLLLPKEYHGKIEVLIRDGKITALYVTESVDIGQNTQTERRKHGTC